MAAKTYVIFGVKTFLGKFACSEYLCRQTLVFIMFLLIKHPEQKLYEFQGNKIYTANCY